MRRRDVLKGLAAGVAFAVAPRVFGRGRFISADDMSLPAVQVNPYSTELVLNSRLTDKVGYTGAALSDQIVANVAWAASKAPLLGSSRAIYVALPDNVYRYDPGLHKLVLHLEGNHLSLASLSMEVGIISDLKEDAGMAAQNALLAAVAFWSGTSNLPGCWPRAQTSTYATNNWGAGTFAFGAAFGLRATVAGLKSDVVAVSSDSSLPNPDTDGNVAIENAIGKPDYGTRFKDVELDLPTLGQIVWASYGNSPHITQDGKAGLTAASAFSNYYLTGSIYVVRSSGVERYHIRTPGGNSTTRDHRIERVTDGDRRTEIRAAVPRLPQTAPNYFVYCPSSTTNYALLETGLAAGNAVLQCTSLGVRSHFTASLSSGEQTAIVDALDIPSSNPPRLVLAAGPGDKRVGIDLKVRDVKAGTATEEDAKNAINEYME